MVALNLSIPFSQGSKKVRDFIESHTSKTSSTLKKETEKAEKKESVFSFFHFKSESKSPEQTTGRARSQTADALNQKTYQTKRLSLDSKTLDIKDSEVKNMVDYFGDKKNKVALKQMIESIKLNETEKEDLKFSNIHMQVFGSQSISENFHSSMLKRFNDSMSVFKSCSTSSSTFAYSNKNMSEFYTALYFYAKENKNLAVAAFLKEGYSKLIKSEKPTLVWKSN